MKKLKLLFLTLILACQLQAQNSNLVLFAEEGEQFWVVMNGLKQNENPETHVKITGLAPTSYKVKIIFKNDSLGEISKTIYLNPATEATYNIRQRKETGVGNKFKRVGNTLANDLNISKPEGKTEELYVIRGVSEVSIAQAPPPVQNTQTVIKYTTAPPATTQTVIVKEQSTTVVTPSHGHSDNVSMGMNIGAPGLNVNVNVNDGHPHQQSTSTTTTIIETGASAPPAVIVYVPGYNGPIGCPVPMSDNDFASAKNSISAKSFEDSKKAMAKQIIASNCLLSSQVRDLMNLFDFEDSKLDVAKYAYGYTYDMGNYFKVNDAFDFESSIDELNEYINSR